jgi:protoporphyrinogen oxidase
MRSAVILGGGLSGAAAAASLARSGFGKVTVVERGPELGGLAGTFEMDGHFYPLAYHHILHLDRPLLYFLDQVGALPSVRWRKIRMLFNLEGRSHNLANPLGFLRFPMSLADKVRFVLLMLRSFRKVDWSDWHGRSARELIDSWAGPGVRETIFERLCRLKFGLPSDDVSAAWLGARLNFREGSAPLGFIPGSNWTKDLCDGLTRMVDEAGVEVMLETTATRLHTDQGRITELELADGRRLSGDTFVSTIPTEVYMRMVPGDDTPYLAAIRYTAVVSAICATRQRVEPEFYWMNLMSLAQSASGFFKLSSLNPSIGAPGDTCFNFMTHVPSRHDEFFKLSDEEIWEAYLADFKQIFGFEMRPFWRHLTKLPLYSPVLVTDFENPPLKSSTWSNLYFAGNYRTFPSTVTTGTALHSGLEAADAILREHGLESEMLADAASYRLRSMPRAG